MKTKKSFGLYFLLAAAVLTVVGIVRELLAQG